jgi:ACS family hexuronate transporter-like MFS transporter
MTLLFPAKGMKWCCQSEFHVSGMIVVLAHMAWLINLSALVVDLVPQKNLGTVFGLVAAGSTAGCIVMNNLVAYSVGAHGYQPAFIAMAGLHLVAWSLLFILLRPYTRKEKLTSSAVQAATP